MLSMLSSMDVYTLSHHHFGNGIDRQTLLRCQTGSALEGRPLRASLSGLVAPGRAPWSMGGNVCRARIGICVVGHKRIIQI